MQYITFSTTDHANYPIAVLTPKLQRAAMVKEYLDPGNIDPEEVIAYQLHVTGKKTKVATQKEFLDEMLPLLQDLGTEYILISDGDYFKTLTGVNKADAYRGYVLPNTYPDNLSGQFNVLYCPNYRQVLYSPQRTREGISQALEALTDYRQGVYEEPGHELLKIAEYPYSVDEIKTWLDKFLEWGLPLTCDVETFSLKHHEAGIGTISFAWSMHEGVSFPVDLGPDPVTVRALLKDFFERFTGKLMYHNITYDACVLIYQLFMDHLLDQKGLLYGIEVMLGDLTKWDDTKLITYLATNACGGNRLSLKDQAQEFAGNYAVENIKDIRTIPLPQLLEYNLVDTCSTWYVYKKHNAKMIEDDQLDFYQQLFKPAVLDIIQMQLSGMPVDKTEVLRVKQLLKLDRDNALDRIQNSVLVREYVYDLNEKWVEWKNSTLKTKTVSLSDAKEEFNPNSPNKVTELLFDRLGLPVLERTDSGQPSATSDILKKVKFHTSDMDILSLLDALLDFKAVDKIYGTFIPPMENAVDGGDGRHYLFGNFNLGGTVSGRLSSSGPNLQTIPATGSKYAKMIKGCFKAPEGYLMIGLDFASLEDRISALTTKDPNKLKVYEENYDGHCLRAYSYFSEEMPDIDPNSVDSINSIADKYKARRQDSKGPTFALTYQGTMHTLIAKFGFTEALARQIEERYHELYKVSDQWVQSKLEEATKTGYVTCAFGLRVRTPLLAQVILGNRATPSEAAAEGRTAGNALGQSWCLLNTRAGSEFMQKARKSHFANQIRPIAQIHDAQYFIVPDDIDVLKYVNQHLVKAVEWQEHPDIEHPNVKLGGELSIFWPTWANEIEIPNHANDDQIIDVINGGIEKYQEKKKAAA